MRRCGGWVGQSLMTGSAQDFSALGQYHTAPPPHQKRVAEDIAQLLQDQAGRGLR
jgi:hypothetical protein